jgi:phosphoribosylformylglycinamidine synthase
VIGTVTTTGNFTARHHGEIVVDIPASALTDDAPAYDVPRTPAPAPTPLALDQVPTPADLGAAWRTLLARPNIASKRWIYQQYDHLVGANTIRRPGGDAAVVRIPGMNRALAITTDCAERHCELDPRGGGRASVFEAARNIACTGALPLAASDCLNFANPEKASTGWRLAEAIEGMSEALEAIGVPVVSGNVSLYNESPERAIYPTPVVGMIGLLEDAGTSVGHAFGAEGDRVVLLGAGIARLDASEWVGEALGAPALPDLEREAALIALLVAAASDGLLGSAHDVSGGGIAVTLAESALAGDVGCVVRLPDDRRADEVLFGESGERVVVTCRPELLDRLTTLAGDVPVAAIGRVGGDTVDVHVGNALIRLDLEIARVAYEATLPEALA